MVRQYYEQGAHVLLIDTGNSYQGLCELIREKTKSVMVCILPIQRKTLLLLILFIPMTEFLILRKESIKTLILTLWKRDDEPPRRSEEVALSMWLPPILNRLKPV